MKGIDISNHNGDIDFNKVKSDGIEVVIIKATEGVDYRDNMLEKNYNGALGKFNIGFYHFMSEKTSPSQQACDFYNAIKDKQYNVLPCLDIEVNSYGRSAKEITDRCIEFINKFKELSGKSVMIYTGGYFGRDLLDSRIKSYPAWIAHYGVNTPMETGFNNVVGHQYTETGRVNGINGNVDMNNFTDKVLLRQSINFNITAVCNIQNEGVREYKGVNNLVIGTTGEAKRLEMTSINIDNVDFTYLCHEENQGDVGGTEGQALGSIGISRRLEGILFNITSIPQGYTFKYRAHIENKGWTDWCISGQYAGTKGQGLRMEAIEIKIE